METALGLLGVALYIVGMLAFSAAVTWGVVWVDGVIRRARGRQPA